MVKKTITTALIVAVFLVALVAGSEATLCMDYCMPICLHTDGAPHLYCKEACEEYCTQADGGAPGPESRLSAVGSTM